jgi:hypothetical protein
MQMRVRGLGGHDGKNGKYNTEASRKGDVMTEDEMRLVTCINGYSEETMLSILYARTAYRSLEQLTEEEED